MNKPACNPRVLIVTPEVTYLPHRMGGLASFYTAKAGGLADVSAALISALFEEKNDRLIAYVLGLSHALNIAFFTALAESGEALAIDRFED